MKVVEKQLKELKMYDNNPRSNDNAVESVANSIKEFGFKVPMVIDKNNVIVCGHTRYKACLELGIDKVPCIIADDLSDDQIKAFRLVENKTNELATWDYEKLEEEIHNIEINLDNFNFNTNIIPFEYQDGGGSLSYDELPNKNKVKCPRCDLEFIP